MRLDLWFPTKAAKIPAPPVGSVPGSSEVSWVHLESSAPPLERKVFSGTFVPPPVSSCQVPSQSTSPVSDPRVAQLIEMVQQMVQQVGQNAVDPGETNDDDDGDDEEAVKEFREKDIVD